MTTEPFTVDLFVRSLSPIGARGRPAETIERLGSLSEVGTIDDYSVTVWGREVELSSEAAAEERERLVLDRVTALRSWAAERGVTLDAFERREVSTPAGETHTVLALPMMVLVESVGNEPACVTPCRTDSGVITVEDRIESLEQRGEEPGHDEIREASREDRRPGLREYDSVPS